MHALQGSERHARNQLCARLQVDATGLTWRLSCVCIILAETIVYIAPVEYTPVDEAQRDEAVPLLENALPDEAIVSSRPVSEQPEINSEVRQKPRTFIHVVLCNLTALLSCNVKLWMLAL